MRWIAVFSALALLACVHTDPVYMRNATTGKVVVCGPYRNNGVNAEPAATHERQCIQDYKEQGFVRVPAPE
jgi:hypothetical protein